MFEAWLLSSLTATYKFVTDLYAFTRFVDLQIYKYFPLVIWPIFFWKTESYDRNGLSLCLIARCSFNKKAQIVQCRKTLTTTHKTATALLYAIRFLMQKPCIVCSLQQKSDLWKLEMCSKEKKNSNNILFTLMFFWLRRIRYFRNSGYAFFFFFEKHLKEILDSTSSFSSELFLL